MPAEWQDKIKDYCEKYNIPIIHLAETLHEPKVVPMIRGKAFEFSVITALEKILPRNEWRISKAVTTDEYGLHDTDIRILHKRTGKLLRVECKLAKKQGYRLFQDGHIEIKVKCMRSRTLGVAKVKELAPRLGVSENVLSIHNDQYVIADFDIVVTSIGNAFYRTDRKTRVHEWKPSVTEEDFLSHLNPLSVKSLKDVSFESMYLASTKDLVIRHSTGVLCTRKQCDNKENCGFIPNYPIIRFDGKTLKPTNGWIRIEESQTLLKSLVTS
jgi:hypothetical protein